jgi:hypothetical protein
MSQKRLPRRLGERQIERCALKLAERGLLTIPENSAEPPKTSAPRNRAERRLVRALALMLRPAGERS